MPAIKTRLRSSFSHIAVSLLLGSSLLGVGLLLLDAPLWAYYLAPLAGTPVLLRLLHLRAGVDPAPQHKPVDAQAERAISVLREQFGALAATTVREVDLTEYLVGMFLIVGVLAAILVPTSSDSASSSLVSILIAVVVFLAFALAVVYFRHNRDHGMSWRQIVAPGEGGWLVLTDDHVRSRHSTREEATAAARRQLREQGGGELVVKGPDGRIRGTDTVAPKRFASHRRQAQR